MAYMYLAARVDGLDRMLGMEKVLSEEEAELARDRDNARQMAALTSQANMGPDYRKARQAVRARRREKEK